MSTRTYQQYIIYANVKSKFAGMSTRTRMRAELYFHPFITSIEDKVIGQLHASAVLPLGKNHWYPLNRRLGGPQSRCGLFGEEMCFLPLPEQKPYLWSGSKFGFVDEV